MASAKGLFFLGAISFWAPAVILYASTRHGLSGKLITFLLPSTFVLAYSLVSIFRTRQAPKPSAAIFMVLGVLFLATFAISIGATLRGAGFLEQPGSTLLGVLLGNAILIYGFIAATYDGILYALIVVSVLMPLVHFVFERQNWIIPPKKRKAETASTQ